MFAEVFAFITPSVPITASPAPKSARSNLISDIFILFFLSDIRTLFCTKCNQTWNLNENGTLTCLNDETIYESITDWFNWERQEVREEILRGEYSYSDEVEVHSLPKPSKFYHLGKAKIRHNKEEGWVLEGNYRNKNYKITRTPVQMEALHVEYDYFRIKRDDCFVINTEDDSFFIYPTKKNIITKLAFATEEMFLLTKNK